MIAEAVPTVESSQISDLRALAGSLTFAARMGNQFKGFQTEVSDARVSFVAMGGSSSQRESLSIHYEDGETVVQHTKRLPGTEYDAAAAVTETTSTFTLVDGAPVTLHTIHGHLNRAGDFANDSRTRTDMQVFDDTVQGNILKGLRFIESAKIAPKKGNDFFRKLGNVVRFLIHPVGVPR